MHERSSSPLLDIWSNDSENIGTKSENPFALYEEIDLQGYELESYLSREMLLRQQWAAAGGWSAKALPPVSQFSPSVVNTSSETNGPLGQLTASAEKEQECEEESSSSSSSLPKEESLHNSTTRGGGIAGNCTLEEVGNLRRRVCMNTSSHVPQRVLGEHNIVARAAEESQVGG